MDDFTEVELYWQKGRVERWIRFGRIAQERIVDRRRAHRFVFAWKHLCLRPLGGE
jgi:hypothetical protein